MSRTHGLNGYSIDLCANGKGLERVSIFRLFGTEVNENHNWKTEINSKISSCYGTLSVLKMLKYLALYLGMPENTWQSLILSKIDYNE